MTTPHRPATPEGRAVASSLSEAHVQVAGLQGCAIPGCACGLRPQIMLEVQGRAVKATDRATAEGLVRSLEKAIAFAWGPEGGGR